MDLMSRQAGFDCARPEGDRHTVLLKPRLELRSKDEALVELEMQVPTEGAWTLRVAGRELACTCRDSPTSPAAFYVEYARPEAPIRLPVSPGDVVEVALEVAWVTTRGVARSQTLFDGEFTVPDAPDRMGAPGYQVNLPGLRTQAYFTVGNVGTPERHHLEVLSFHTTLLVRD